MSEADDIEVAARSLPWWRRPRKLRRQLSGTLVFVAFLSVVSVGGLNFFAARQLLDVGTKQQLVGIGEARATSVEVGVERVLGQISALAADLAVVQALEDLTVGYEALADDPLDADQLDDLDEFYEESVVAPLSDLGVEPVSLDDVRPRSDAGRYLQYQYLLPFFGDGGESDTRRSVDDAGDGSTYSDAHADHHEYLSSLATALGAGDLMLISAGTNDVVYSVEKRIDVGTSLVDGPYSDSLLARTVADRLPRLPTGDAVISDFQIYVPGGARPVLFVAAAVRSDTEVIGTLVVQVPVESLNSITTADGNWEAVGLGSGESYVVGSDSLLRSESRAWIEDPEGYLDKTDPDLAGLIEALGSPVGLQPVDTEPARRAIDGEIFEGTAKNYLGQQVFSYAAPIDVAGVDWVMVAETPISDARSPLIDYLVRLGLVLLIVLPVAALIGFWLSGRLTRPIAPVVDAALSVAQGERNPILPDLRRDEFGDLARRLGNMSAELAEHEAELEGEFLQQRELLVSVVPDRFVGEDGAVGAIDPDDVATVVAVRVELAGDGQLEEASAAADAVGDTAAVVGRVAAEHPVDRIRASADGYLFVAGKGDDDDGADSAMRFSVALVEALTALATEEHTDVAGRVALSTGAVATGVLDSGSLTFAAWGEPVRRALAILSLSNETEIVVDSSTAAVLTADHWELAATADGPALDGQPMSLRRLTPSP